MVKQYVGARYVPKFASPVDWAPSTSYEALTIVTFNNASYTSKVPVPPTVGNPANNPQYWALTGNYNAQVEQYRQEAANAAEDAAKASQAAAKVGIDLTTEIQNRTAADKKEAQDRTNALNALKEDLNSSKYYVTPEDFGGVGDGTTNDYNALQSAINSGKTVKLTDGKTYLTGTALTLRDYVDITGNASITSSAEYVIDQERVVHNLIFNNVTFTGKIKMCTFYSAMKHCVFNGDFSLINGDATGTLVENRLENSTFNGAFTSDAGGKITDVFVSECNFKGTGNFDVGVSAGWSINNNHFYNDGGINLGHTYNTNFSGNYIEPSVKTVSLQVQVNTSFLNNTLMGAGTINLFNDGYRPVADYKTIVTNNNGPERIITANTPILTDFTIKVSANTAGNAHSFQGSGGVQAVNLNPGENTVTVKIPTLEAYQRGFIELTFGSARFTTQNPFYIKTGVIYLAKQASAAVPFTNWTDTEVPLSNFVVDESASTVTFTITLPEGQYGQMIMKVYI